MDAVVAACDEGDSTIALGQQEHGNDSKARFQAACRRLGMADYAASAWQEWHVKPIRILVVCMSSVVACCIVVVATFLPGCTLDSWYPLTFVVGYGVSQSVQVAFYWRRGPRHAGTPAQVAGFAVMVLCLLALLIPAIAGPLQLVPFKNRLLTTALLSITVWLFVLGGATGGAAADKPPVPYTSLAAPLL